ncbi:hypothetical protein E2C01_012947 [Portunus trituberculatus]|uniref:Uncharacterized protein n=1 Tax=Portunus trituberculatus TaxID=210409 RepID=A0A5B7DFM8_PORTR|nr:hypothetical protein [Portunus trituberculatus]
MDVGFLRRPRPSQVLGYNLKVLQGVILSKETEREEKTRTTKHIDQSKQLGAKFTRNVWVRSYAEAKARVT